jgi:membrane protein
MIFIQPKLNIMIAFFKYFFRRFKEDECSHTASALTFMTLFALVPMMTLMFSLFTLVPFFLGLEDKIQDLIFNHFVPQSGKEIQEYLNNFLDQARGLSIIGGAVLLITSYLMLSSIERAFNKIWNNTKSRRGLYSFFLYWSVLSICPLLLGFGLIIQTYFFSFQLLSNNNVFFVTSFFMHIFPLLLTWGVFGFIFIAIPNCEVSKYYGAIGGLFASIFFELAKALFGTIVSYSSYASIYGVFAVFPIFLIWIYLVWMIVLAGAELVRSLETFK